MFYAFDLTPALCSPHLPPALQDDSLFRVFLAIDLPVPHPLACCPPHLAPAMARMTASHGASRRWVPAWGEAARLRPAAALPAAAAWARPGPAATAAAAQPRSLQCRLPPNLSIGTGCASCRTCRLASCWCGQGSSHTSHTPYSTLYPLFPRVHHCTQQTKRHKAVSGRA
eukprot:359231-Chlamydomonas_euryale.AAC.3